MQLIIFVIIWWMIAYSAERAKAAWRRTRDTHANQISSANPGWSHRRVRRAANRRAMLWWAHELRGGLPTIRGALIEDWQHIRHMREQDQLAGERRRAVLRRELEQRRAQRAAYERAIETGATTLPFIAWIDAGCPDAPAPAAAPDGTAGGPAAEALAPAAEVPAPAGGDAGPSAPALEPRGRRLRVLPPPDGPDAGAARPATNGAAASSVPQAPAPAAAASGGPAPAIPDGGAAHAAPAANPSPARPDGAPVNGGTAVTDSTMEAPNIEAARQVATGQADSMRDAANRSEQFENDLITGGMDNDSATMAAVRAAQELTAQAAAAWASVKSELDKHAQGEEYANTGHAAKTEFLRNS